MPSVNRKARTPRAVQKKLERLSPFELKDKLIALAGEHAKKSASAFLNAGRGNPNWIATAPRDAFFLLGQFAVGESRLTLAKKNLAGMPQLPGIAGRFRAFLNARKNDAGADLLRDALDYATGTLEFDADAFVHELADGIIGDNYPVPDRMLTHAEKIVHEYLEKEMCAGKPPKGRYDLFAVEGGTAAMCYVFDSLMQNGLLHRGGSVALLVPTFTPYLEIPELDRYAFNVVKIDAGVERRKDGTHTWQYADAEIDKLLDKKIKVVCVVNPSNPPSVAIRRDSMKRLVSLVKTKRPDLIIVTDDVYGTFVPGFRSLMAELPANVIGVYSFSKHFGCTGWRLGVVAIHEKNIFDEKIAALPAKTKTALARRYGTISLTPEKIKFIDRMVADSRSVALNHTAGLSLPQQIQMTLFSLFALLDKDDAYKSLCREIVRERYEKLFSGLGFSPPADESRAAYYCEIDLMVWAENRLGKDFAAFLKRNYEPVDVLFRLAERSGIVLMDGGGFGGPPWSVRVSLANLPTESYAEIGRHLAEIAGDYAAEWKAKKT